MPNFSGLALTLAGMPLGLGTKIVHKELLLQTCSFFVSNRSSSSSNC